MSDQAKYRWPTVITAGTAITLSAFTIWWVLAAYHDFRSADFTRVSGGPVLGSCLEAASDDQLKLSRIDETGWPCSASSKEELTNLLAVSVHAMYRAHVDSAFTGENLAVLAAVVDAAKGNTPSYVISSQRAYNALSLMGTPSATTCDALYSGGAEEAAAPAPVDPLVACASDMPADGDNAAPALDVSQTNTLYTHCMTQFGYARSGPAKGTFGIPKVGNELKPMGFPVIGTNSTTAWYDRSRILVGTRWGYASVFYVVAMMATAFFLMDATILLLAELTRVCLHECFLNALRGPTTTHVPNVMLTTTHHTRCPAGRRVLCAERPRRRLRTLHA